MISEEGVHRGEQMCFVILWLLLYIRNPLNNIYFKKLVGGGYKAAADFTKTYNGKSIKLGREMASTIGIGQDKGQAFYSYGEASVGSAFGAKPSPAPEGTVPDSDGHTHREWLPHVNNEDFSPEDKKYARDHKLNAAYVATPDGSLKEFDVKTGTVTVLSRDLPSDKHDRNRKNKNPVIEPSLPQKPSIQPLPKPNVKAPEKL